MVLLIIRVSEQVCLLCYFYVEDSVVDIGGPRTKEIKKGQFLHVARQARVEALSVVVVPQRLALSEVPFVEANHDEEGERLL